MNRSVTRLFPVRLGVWTSTALTCAVLLIASAPTARAGVNVWTTHGPYGASVSALAIDSTTPTTLSAGTGAGVYKSTNGGSSWSAVNTGLSGDAFYVAARACRYVGSVAASPSAATRRGPPRAGIRKRSPASPRERGRGRCSAPPANPSNSRYNRSSRIRAAMARLTPFAILATVAKWVRGTTDQGRLLSRGGGNGPAA